MYALLLLPLLKKIVQRGYFLLGIIFFAILTKVGSSNEYLFNCSYYSQVLIIGLYCAKTQLLIKYSDKIFSKKLWLVIAVSALIIRCGISSLMGLAMDVLVVPIFTIAICALFSGKEQTSLFCILTKLGKCSTYMWFVHCIFFSTATRIVFQSSPIWTNSLLGIFIVVTIISYVIAITLNKVETMIYKKI